MSDIGFDLINSELIASRMDRLGNTIVRAVASKALRAGGKIVQAAGKRNAPHKSGAIERAIAVRAGKRNEGSVSIFVGPGKRWFAGDTWYGAFLEFGHRAGSRKLGDARKQIPGKHFMEHSFEESKASAVEAIQTTFLAELETAAAVH